MSVEMKTTPVEESAIPEITTGLNQFLANSYALMAQIHLAHWNVEGKDFFSLHGAFEEQYTELFAAVDEIAERVRALDHYAAGGIRALADKSQISEGPSEASCNSKDFVSSVILGHEKVLEQAFKLRDLAGEKGDSETEDLVIARIQTHQKFIWMLQSYLK